MDEASLAYPGSTQLGELALDQQTRSITATIAAQFGHQFGTGASQADVEAFYEAELERRGCISAESLEVLAFEILGSTESRVRIWEKDDAFFRVSFKARDEQGRLDAVTHARYQTCFWTEQDPFGAADILQPAISERS